jgi:2-polyprenyl-6-methoxyphenol hydroxylase-like FAD-dependent oxidoreductase
MNAQELISSPSDRASRFGGGHAVVIGAGMAGLVTARILANHFERITIVERDRLPDAANARPSVPQGRHVHLLLGAGLDIIDELFPGIVSDLVGRGAFERDFGELSWFHHGAWRVQFRSGIPAILCSRPFLEEAVSRRVRALENLEILEGTRATGLRVSAARDRVTGLDLERAGQGPTTLDADLVVDVGGRSSQAPRWLESAGYRRPPESKVAIDFTYVSRLYRCPDRYLDQPTFFAVYPRPPEQKRAGILSRIEGDRWIVSLSGYVGERPARGDASFLAFAKTLPRPEIHDLIKDAEPLSAPVIHRFPSDRRRHFERLPRGLEGFVVSGDAACSFNPIFGQGMSAACLGAKALDRCLREQPRGDIQGLAARFQQALADVTDLPWSLATSEDLRYPEAIGARPRGFAATGWYTSQLEDRCSYDTEVYGRWLLVMHLIRGLDTLFTPSMAWKALSHALRSAFGLNPEQARAEREPIRKADPVTRAYVRRYMKAEQRSMKREGNSTRREDTKTHEGGERRQGEESALAR